MIARPESLTAETDGMPLPNGETQAPVYRRVVGTLQKGVGQ